MARKQVVVEVSPSRLEVAEVRSGRVVASRVQRPEATAWEEQWPAVLDQLAGSLSKMVQEMGCAGAEATVLYTGPGTISTTCACPPAAGSAGAEQATVLAMNNLADFPVAMGPHAVTRLSAGAAKRSDRQRQVHCLGIADAEKRAAAIADWAENAGLRVRGLAPLDAPAIVAAASAACGGAEGTGPMAVLWVGEHTSVLAAGTDGELGFVRTIGVGCESLVEALTRPIRSRLEGGPISLDRETARAVLMQVGIPSPDQPVPGRDDIDGSGLLPLLQPAVQRLTIEVKQSLRFGVPEDQRGGVVLRVCGPGGRAPNLGEVLARQCGVRSDGAVGAPGATGWDDCTSAGGGAIGAWLANGRMTPSLLPERQRGERQVRRMRTALVAGSAAAMLLVGAETIVSYGELSTERARLAELTAARNLETASELKDRALGARLALTEIERRIDTRLGEAPDWAALFGALASATPEEVELTHVGMKKSDNEAECLLRGYVRLDRTSDATGTIKRYVDGLAAHPLVADVRMGTTQRVRVDAIESQGFELSLTPVAVPASAAAKGADAAVQTAAEEALP